MAGTMLDFDMLVKNSTHVDHGRMRYWILDADNVQLAQRYVVAYSSEVEPEVWARWLHDAVDQTAENCFGLLATLVLVPKFRLAHPFRVNWDSLLSLALTRGLFSVVLDAYAFNQRHWGAGTYAEECKVTNESLTRQEWAELAGLIASNTEDTDAALQAMQMILNMPEALATIEWSEVALLWARRGGAARALFEAHGELLVREVHRGWWRAVLQAAYLKQPASVSLLDTLEDLMARRITLDNEPVVVATAL